MPRERARPSFRWRFWLSALAWCAVFVSSALAARQAHRFMLRDPQFIFSREDRHALTLDGVTYAARSKILRVFAGDYGHSIFAVPLDERRRRLLAVDWVEDAAVARVWPNHLLVRITERRPVAFVSLPLYRGSGQAARFLLVDAQGVLLDPPGEAQFSFPVLSGVREDESDSQRREQVRALLRLEEDLGPLAKDISEVNAADPSDLRMVAQVDNRAVELAMGDDDFGRRYRNFLNHYPDIRRTSPDVNSFDLRLEDRITAKGIAASWR